MSQDQAAASSHILEPPPQDDAILDQEDGSESVRVRPHALGRLVHETTFACALASVNPIMLPGGVQSLLCGPEGERERPIPQAEREGLQQAKEHHHRAPAWPDVVRQAFRLLLDGSRV